MEKIIDFLNTKQKISLLEYELLENDNFLILENGDKIKLLNKSNYKYEKGGTIILVTPYFIKIKFRNRSKIIYPNQYYIFYYKKPKSFNEQLEYFLDGLNSKNIILTKK